MKRGNSRSLTKILPTVKLNLMNETISVFYAKDSSSSFLAKFDQNSLKSAKKAYFFTPAVGNFDSTVKTADSAVTTAGMAVKTADSAVKTVDSAVTTADMAVTTADSAVTTADMAVTTADMAVTTFKAIGGSIAPKLYQEVL